MNNYDNNPYNYGPGPNYYQPGFNNYPQQQNTYNKSQRKQYEFVNGIEGAKSYYVTPNQTMLLMDADYPICYRKTSDQNGKCTLNYYELREIDEQTVRNMMNPAPQNIFASKEDVDNINKRLDEIFKRLDKTNKKDIKDSSVNNG